MENSAANSLPNLLIVDDNYANIILLEVILEKFQVNLIKAESGFEALDKSNGLELALAILDIQMPGMNGFELALKINEGRGSNKVPIIFVTANHVNDVDVSQGYISGGVDYIFKPINSHILLSKVNIFLELFNHKQTIVREAFQLEKNAENLIWLINALKTSEEKYRSYIDNAPDGIFVADETGKCIELNNAVCRMTGYSKDELLKMSIPDILAEESREVGLSHFKKLQMTGTLKTDLLFNHKNATKHWWAIDAVKLTETQFLVFANDITKRKLAEHAMNISEEKYRTMLNASPDGILLIDLKKVITEVSEIGLELFDADRRDDLVGKDFYKFIPPEETNTINDIFEKTVSEGLVQNVELKIRKKSQDTFFSEISSTLIQAPGGEPLSFMIIIRDISQRKKIETKQLHADRMANLGEMASGIAHEINQPLNIISMVMDKILFETEKAEKIDIEFLKTKSDKIFDNITRIRNIIDHVRAFSRNDDNYVLTAFNINSSIENAVSMVLEQFKHLDINLNTQLNQQIPQLVGNTYKFEQVIVNLLTNAKDAVLEKRNRQGDCGDLKVEIKTYQENQSLIVEITDNGIGIDKDDIHNIMLPFYTTKEEGKGTGLGLSICYQIIKEMNGSIDISSDGINGTKIRLVLDIQKPN